MLENNKYSGKSVKIFEFWVPKRFVSSHIILLLFNAVLSLFFLQIDALIKSPFYYIFCVSIFFYTLFVNSNNFVYFLRTAFLGVVGYFAMGIKLLNTTALFGFHMPQSQTIEIASIMYVMTNIGLFSSQLGLLYFRPILGRDNKYTLSDVPLKMVFIIINILLFLSIYVNIKGGNILLLSSRGGANAMLLNTTGVIVNILFFAAVLLYFKRKHIYQKRSQSLFSLILISCSILLFILGSFMRGERLDALCGILGCYFLIQVYVTKKTNVNLKILSILAILYGFMKFIGKIRHLKALSIEDLVRILTSVYDISNENKILFFQGTLNDIATTFSGTIMLVKEGYLDFHYGSTYFDYLSRTPPSFLNLTNPQIPALYFRDFGFTTGGAFFELGEAYINFGILGAFITPLVVSGWISFAMKKFLERQYSLKAALFLFAVLAVMLRGFWYQSFVFYKTFITACILLFILSFFEQVFFPKRLSSIQNVSEKKKHSD
jgi:hypothetical protein